MRESIRKELKNKLESHSSKISQGESQIDELEDKLQLSIDDTIKNLKKGVNI